jgi:hypothetical protein
VADSNDINQTVAIRNAEYDSPLADANAPKVRCAFQLYNSAWARSCHKRLDLFEDLPGNLRIKVLQFFARRPREDD